MSQPTRWLMNNNLLKGDILDFGCGYGIDVEELSKLGFNIMGYDKYYKPEYPKTTFDTIICQFVLNVVDEDEQDEIIKQIKLLLNKDAKAYFTVRIGLKQYGYKFDKRVKKYSLQRFVRLPFKIINSAPRYRFVIYEMTN